MNQRSYRSAQQIGLLIILLTVLSLQGCCLWSKKTPEEEPSANLLYEQGLELMHKKLFDDAREKFNKVKVVSSDTDLELLAQIAVGDSYFEEEEYEAARAQYEEIYKLHSGGKVADYLQYRIGECYFWQIDTIDRDTTNAKEALKTFNRFIEDFPESEYIQRAELRINEVHTFLAESEYFIGAFYLRKNAFFAAINRFKKALERYPQSGIEDKLLYHLHKTYKRLKDEDHALEYRKLLLNRFPNSEYIPLIMSDKQSALLSEPLAEIPSPAASQKEGERLDAGLAGTYQGKDKGSWFRRLLLLETKSSQEGSEGGLSNDTDEDLQKRSFWEKLIPW